MKKLSRLLLVGVLALGTASLSWAMWDANTNMQGTVRSINSNTVIVSKAAGGQEISLQTDDHTKLNGAIRSLGDLRSGDHVKVSYKEEDNQKIATIITKEEGSRMGDSSTM